MDMQRFIQISFCLFMWTNVCTATLCSGIACETKQQPYKCVVLHGRCTCNQGYSLNSTTGDCDDVDECASHYYDPCGHRGRCTNSIGSYFCNCRHGWKNNTHCLPEEPNVDCTLCMPGYEGYRCNHTVCEHGFAEPIGMDDFSCVCSPGWEKQVGQKSPCNIDVNECLLPGVCNTYQICINTPGNYMCECYPSWTGNDCATYNCSQGGCHNGGTCLRGHCICPKSVTGPTCAEIFTQGCKDIVAVLPDTMLVCILFGLLVLMLLIIVVLSYQLCFHISSNKRISPTKSKDTGNMSSSTKPF